MHSSCTLHISVCSMYFALLFGSTSIGSETSSLVLRALRSASHQDLFNGLLSTCWEMQLFSWSWTRNHEISWIVLNTSKARCCSYTLQTVDGIGSIRCYFQASQTDDFDRLVSCLFKQGPFFSSVATPASCESDQTCFRRLMWSYVERKNTTMSSRYFKISCRFTKNNVAIITGWKIVGTFFDLKDTCASLFSLLWDVKAVSSQSAISVRNC